MDEEFKLHDGIKDPSLEFEIRDNLGKGAFGAVYLAKYLRTGHEVAVKQVLVNEDFMEILKEINIMKQCKSKYVVQYFGNYFKGDTCWIIMEYCAHGSIGDLMNLTSTPLSEQQIAMVCRSMLKGLAYLHKSNKIHRDIKPGNVLVTSKGECKLADFGVSGQLSERTRTRNTVIGTPFFLAPEVIMETGYDSKADIWALGISAIEMAEMHPPYYDVHPMRVLFLIPSSPSPTLRNPSKFSAEFNDFLRLCLTKDCSQRPSAKQMLKHPFIAGARNPDVIMPFVKRAQLVIDQHGSRLKALKHLASQKMKGAGSNGSSSGSDNDMGNQQIQSDSDSDSDDSDDEPPKKVVPPVPVVPSSPRTTPGSPSPQSRAGQSSIQELDDILSGMMKPPQPAAPSSPRGKPAAAAPVSRGYTPPAQSPKTTAPAAELDDILASLSSPSTSSPNISSSGSKINPTTAPSSVPSITPTHPNNSNNTNGTTSSSITIKGQWNSSNCGGCVNSYKWRQNSQYSLTLPPSSSAYHLKVTLRQTAPDKLVHIGMYMAKVTEVGRKLLTLTKENSLPEVETNFVKNKSITFELKLQSGNYVIVPSTFSADMHTTYELEVNQLGSIHGVPSPTVSLISSATDWIQSSVSNEWIGASAGGSFSPTSSTWRDNPKILLTVQADSRTRTHSTVTLLLGRDGVDLSSIPAGSPGLFIGFYIFRALSKSSPSTSLSGANLVAKTSFVNALEVSHTQQLEPGTYVVIPCTFEQGQKSKFTVMAFSSGAIEPLTIVEDSGALVRGAWSGGSAGGCLNNSTWRSNPQYMLVLNPPPSNPTKVTISLEQLASTDSTRQIPFIGFYVAKASAPALDKKIYSLAPKDVVGNTEFINDLQVALTLDHLPSNSPWVIIPSTFLPNTETSFTLRAALADSTSITLKFVPLPDWNLQQSKGLWKGVTAGGRYSTTSSAWTMNPRFLLRLTGGGQSSGARTSIVLTQSEKQAPIGIGFYVFKRSPDNVLREVLGKSGFVSGREVSCDIVIPQGSAEVFVIPATFEPGLEDTFTVSCYVDQSFTLTPYSI